MKILVLGAAGQVGRAVANAVPAQHAVLAKTRAELDILDESAVTATLAQARIDWIINAAAYTAVDRAETERGEALAERGRRPGEYAADRANCSGSPRPARPDISSPHGKICRARSG